MDGLSGNVETNYLPIILEPSRPNLGRREKINALKAFIKSFEAPQRSLKVIFISIQLSEMHEKEGLINILHNNFIE